MKSKSDMKIHKKLFYVNKTKVDMKIYFKKFFNLLYINKRKSDMKIYFKKLRRCHDWNRRSWHATPFF